MRASARYNKVRERERERERETVTFDELSEEQKLELKQRILTERNEQRGEGTSYGELAEADTLVSDEDARDWAEGMEFSPDDFSCSAS